MESRTSTAAPHPCLHRVGACRWNIIFGLSTLCVTSLAICIIYFYYAIRSPSISVASASVSAFNVTASSISGIWDVSFDVRNLNRKTTASYQKLQASLHYKRAELSRTSILPFHQGPREETTLRTALSAIVADVDPSIINALNGERKASGSVDFTVKLTAQIEYKEPWHLGDIWGFACRNILVALPENSNHGTTLALASAGGSKECAAHRRGVWTRAVVYLLGFVALSCITCWVIYAFILFRKFGRT